MPLNRIFVIPLFFQALSVVFPFIYLKLAYTQGIYQALSSELIQAIVGFSIVAIDFSASTFLAKKQMYLCKKGAVLTVISGRLLVSFLVFIIGALIVSSSDEYSTSTNIISLFLILFSISVDPSWINVGRGKVWFPAFVSFARFLTASILILLNIDAVLSLALSYFLLSIILLFYFRNEVFKSFTVKFTLYTRILKNYFVPTISEALTAAFSRLDVFFAVMLLRPGEALTYTLIRKIIIGFQSLAQSGSKHIYLSAGTNNFEFVKNQFRLLCYSLFVLSIPVCMLVSIFLFDQLFSVNLVISVSIMSLLIIITYYKTLYQFAYLYAVRRFKIDIACASLSFVFFIVGFAILYFLNLRTLEFFSSLRLLTDFIYILFAVIFIRVKK